MSAWFRIQEFVVEIGLRLAKVMLASLIGAFIYFVLTNVVGAPGSVQLALEAWIAGGIVFLLLETGIF
jgi:cytosine/uracil/thiamine/allantoin permease